MKYRMLTEEERQIFDEDFKYFLISNGVKNEEWLEMNAKSPEKAEKLVELFSDAVLDVVYKKVEFIEYRSENSCMVFRCLKDHIQVISLVAKEGQTVDLSTPEKIHQTLVEAPEKLSVFKTQKPYNQTREEEIHQMLEQGCVNSHRDFWVSLEKILADD